jgi:hypothetical protein
MAELDAKLASISTAELRGTGFSFFDKHSSSKENSTIFTSPISATMGISNASFLLSDLSDFK